MSNEFNILALTAISIGFMHTILGPDHYLPFIVMSRARRWSIYKVSFITLVCGLGHVLSSVVLGFLGIGLGTALSRLTFIESVRGELAAWFLIAFGFAYCVWGIRRAIKNKTHSHTHDHQDETAHKHIHTHTGNHSHVHYNHNSKNITPWILFTIFVFGPCEPLIPLVMFPAAKGSMPGVFLIASLFGITTIVTMLCVVIGLSYGLSMLPIGRLERYTHALAGFTIFLCGGAIKFLGL